MQCVAQAPSNIALIKYMGKKDTEKNIPSNPSLSYTLSNLVSTVVLNEHSGKNDIWEPLYAPGGIDFELSLTAQARFLKHLSRLKQYFNYTGSFIVQSNNNFPHGSGLASSASSFAALTKCAVTALCELTQTPMLSIETQASLSRLGSGSSCRSFFSPWALWINEEVDAVELPYVDLIHQVIIISHEEKKVSSSEAHQRIQSSTSYTTRPGRAVDNLKVLLNAFEKKDWPSAAQICWHEFQDLHQLFATAAQPFSYMTDKTNEVLKTLQDFWVSQGDGPIITMDAGPNIHLLYRSDQADLALKFKHDHLIGNYDVL